MNPTTAVSAKKVTSHVFGPPCNSKFHCTEFVPCFIGHMFFEPFIAGRLVHYLILKGMMTSRGRWRRSLACESGCFLIAIIDVSAFRRSCRLRWYVALQGRQRAIVAARHLNIGASTVLHELPGIALVVVLPRTLSQCARAV